MPVLHESQPDSREPTEPPQNGDPSSIATRVLAIESLIQFHGQFQRFPGDENEKRLATYFPPVVTAAFAHSSTAIGVNLYFTAFVAIEDSKAHELLKSATSQPPGIELVLPDAKDGLRAIVEAAFAIQYSLSDGPVPKQADLKMFAEVNGRLNANPYWREFLDSSLRRAGLPSVLAPVVVKQRGQ